MRRKLLAVSCSLLALALILAGAALAGNGGIAPPEPRSPNAERITDTYWLIMVFTGAVFFLVEISLIVFIVRFRSRGRSREVEGPQIRGHLRLELIWTAIPVLILAAIASFVFYKLPGIKDVPAAGAAGSLRVKVEGRQFYWRFTYPNGAVAVNELRVPVDRVVELDITAPAYDVAHSWWVPQLGGKLDAIPGQTNHTWFRAEREGIYRGQCAEFCGAQHALMLARVNAMPADVFQAWLAKQAVAAPDLGRETFLGACAPCHGDQGQGLIGPPLKGNGTVADRKALEKLVRNGGVVMPAVGRDWNAKQFDALSAYVKKRFAPGGGGGGG